MVLICVLCEHRRGRGHGDQALVVPVARVDEIGERLATSGE